MALSGLGQDMLYSCTRIATAGYVIIGVRHAGSMTESVSVWSTTVGRVLLRSSSAISRRRPCHTGCYSAIHMHVVVYLDNGLYIFVSEIDKRLKFLIPLT